MKKLALVIAVCALGIAAYVQAQPGGGRQGQRGGQRGGMFSLDGDWALICFELKVDSTKLNMLRPFYQEAYDQRKTLMEEMRSGDVDRMALMEGMAAIQQDLEAGVKGVLDDGQFQLLTKLRGERAGGWGGGGGGRRGGGGGGGWE